MKKPKVVQQIIDKIAGEPKNEKRLFEQALSEIKGDFSVRITGNKIVVKDEVTYLRVLPKDKGDIIIEKVGEKLMVAIEKTGKDE